MCICDSISAEIKQDDALALGWREDQLRWNNGFYPSILQVHTAPAQTGKIAVWKKFVGQAP